jgi:hypothetical protein
MRIVFRCSLAIVDNRQLQSTEPTSGIRGWRQCEDCRRNHGDRESRHATTRPVMASVHSKPAQANTVPAINNAPPNPPPRSTRRGDAPIKHQTEQGQTSQHRARRSSAGQSRLGPTAKAYASEQIRPRGFEQLSKGETMFLGDPPCDCNASKFCCNGG